MDSSKKMFYTMGEIVEMFDVSPSLIRHWERQFDVINPRRNNKGNRLFTPSDLENFKIIYNLIRERKMTIKGAQQAMAKGHMVDGSSLSRDTQIKERLSNLRAMLVELRTMMKDGQESINSSVEEQIQEAIMDDIVEEIEEKNIIEEEVLGASRTRRIASEPDATEKELFAFHEQRLPLPTSNSVFEE